MMANEVFETIRTVLAVFLFKDPQYARLAPNAPKKVGGRARLDPDSGIGSIYKERRRAESQRLASKLLVFDHPVAGRRTVLGVTISWSSYSVE
jgi:hypothetical protein